MSPLLANNPNCCTGYYNNPTTCTPSGVEYYSYFSAYYYCASVCLETDRSESYMTEGNCPNAYAYAYDEQSGTALWTCDSNKRADYTITFCPPPA